MDAATAVRPLVESIFGSEPPLRLTLWDGSSLGPPDAGARLSLRSPRALQRIVRAPGQLGFGRAFVAGEIDLDGDLFEVLRLGELRPDIRLGAREWATAVLAALRAGALHPRRLPRPPEEARLRGRRHSARRDAEAVAHHYDVGNDFYRIVLGPTMTYSCAYFSSPGADLDEAQVDKNELVCRKLRLRPGERMLDVGCGWGTLAIHAASRFGVRVVGVTLSGQQADLARRRVAEAGVADRVEIRVQDERHVHDGPYDAVSSIGMFEHVGEARLGEYFRHLYELLRPRGRLLNHGIARPSGDSSRFARRSFIDAFVFPDGELHEVGRVISVMQEAGFEVRDLEGLREHYALTLRSWVANLERDASQAAKLAGESRYRVWRLYMAASALSFERGENQIHQVLAVRPDGGRSGLPLRRADIVMDEDSAWRTVD